MCFIYECEFRVPQGPLLSFEHTSVLRLDARHLEQQVGFVFVSRGADTVVDASGLQYATRLFDQQLAICVQDDLAALFDVFGGKRLHHRSFAATCWGSNQDTAFPACNCRKRFVNATSLVVPQFTHWPTP